jgi:hypothetical protein
MTDDLAAPPRRSRRRRFWLVVLVLTLVCLLARAGLDLWAGYRLDQEVARLEKRYGSLAEKSLNSPHVPAADNRARVARAAAALSVLDFGSRQELAPLRYLESRSSPPLPAGVRAYVEINRPAIRIAEQTRSRGMTSWEADYVSSVGFPPLMELRVLSNAICLAALIDLEDGRPDSALRQTGTGLAFASTLREEPLLIPQLIRIAAAGVQFRAIQRIVVSSEPSGSALEDVAHWLAESRSPSPISLGLLGEVRLGHAAWKKIESGRVEDLIDATHNPPAWVVGPYARLSRPLARLAHLRYLESFGRLLEIQAGPRPRPDFVSAPPPVMRRLLKPFEAWSITAGLVRSVEVGDQFTSELNAAELAVALRRFRLDHGTYPDDLSALAPEYLASVPIDPFTGRPPVYTRKGAGFELHAEGPKTRTPRPPTLDWIVPK